MPTQTDSIVIDIGQASERNLAAIAFKHRAENKYLRYWLVLVLVLELPSRIDYEHEHRSSD